MGMTPQQVAQKWRQRSSAATEDYRRGVEAVTKSPGDSAADQIDLMKAKLLEAFDNGTVERALRNIKLEDWKAITAEKGTQRYGTGVALAEGKMDEFMTQFLPFLEAGVKNLPKRGTKEQNKQRMVAMFDHNSKFKFKKR